MQDLTCWVSETVSGNIPCSFPFFNFKVRFFVIYYGLFFIETLLPLVGDERSFMAFTGLIDYGMGNLLSVSKALAAAGGEIRIVRDPAELTGADRIVLPGVGNFGDGMEHLRDSGFVPFVREWIRADRPFLGICLGMQMLLERSEEAPGVPGLGIVPGEVVRFPEGSEKVPHIGWNEVTVRPGGGNGFFPESGAAQCFYFVHSYYAIPDEPEIIAGTCDYGIDVTAALSQNNLFSTQFHPEKSGEAGRNAIKIWLEK